MPQIAERLRRIVELNAGRPTRTRTGRLLSSRTGRIPVPESMEPRWTGRASNATAASSEWSNLTPEEIARAMHDVLVARHPWLSVDYGRQGQVVRQAPSDDDALNFRTLFNGDWAAIEEDRPAGSAEQRAKVDAPSRDLLVRTRITVAERATSRQALGTDAERLLGYTPLRTDAKATSAFRAALACLDIPTLDQDAVDKYKAQMVDHYETHGKKPSMPTWRLKPLKGYNLPVPEFVLRKAVQIAKELPGVQFFVDQLACDPFLIATMTPLYDSAVNQASRLLDPDLSAYIEVWDEPKFEEAL